MFVNYQNATLLEFGNYFFPVAWNLGTASGKCGFPRDPLIRIFHADSAALSAQMGVDGRNSTCSPAAFSLNGNNTVFAR